MVITQHTSDGRVRVDLILILLIEKVKKRLVSDRCPLRMRHHMNALHARLVVKIDDVVDHRAAHPARLRRVHRVVDHIIHVSHEHHIEGFIERRADSAEKLCPFEQAHQPCADEPNREGHKDEVAVDERRKEQAGQPELIHFADLFNAVFFIGIILGDVHIAVGEGSQFP